MYDSKLYEPYLLVHSAAQVSLLVYDRRSCVSTCTHVSTYVPMACWSWARVVIRHIAILWTAESNCPIDQQNKKEAPLTKNNSSIFEPF